MTPSDDRLPPPEPIRDFWDAFVGGRAAGTPGDLDPTWAETIGRLHAVDDAPAPDAAMVQRIWQDTLRRQATAQVGGLAAANGRHATTALLDAPVLTLPGRDWTVRRWSAVVRRQASEVVREVGVAVLAGFVVGLIAIGGGARLIMRLLAITAEPALQGGLTNSGERVGEITFGGTLFLLLTGAVAGAGLGLLFALVRPWLPWRGWRRGLVFGLLLTAVFGSLALENGTNPDYRRFGIPFLNVCLFNLLPLLFGLLLVPLAERIERVVRGPRPARRFAARAWFLALAMVTLLALAAVVPLLLGAAPLGLAVAALLLTRAALTRWVGRFERPTDLLARPAAFAAAYAVLALPTAVGLYLTLRAAGRILGA